MTAACPYEFIIFATMIAIENNLVSDEIVEEKFVCDLNKCKGGCCVDGDAGAPLEAKELRYLKKIYRVVEPYLTEEGKKEIAEKGHYVFDEEFGWVTPTLSSGMCAYGVVDTKGIVKCGIEKAFNEKKFSLNKNWKKPVSCHLFPIRVKQTGDTHLLNNEPRQGLCDPACALGKQLKVPVYLFLKKPLIGKFGEEFYNALEAIANYKAPSGK